MTFPLQISESRQLACEDLFLSARSALQPCFDTMDPRPFLELCLANMREQEESEDSAVACSVAIAYVEQCRLRGIELYSPPACVQCNDGGVSLRVRV